MVVDAGFSLPLYVLYTLCPQYLVMAELHSAYIFIVYFACLVSPVAVVAVVVVINVRSSTGSNVMDNGLFRFSVCFSGGFGPIVVALFYSCLSQ